jgi:hypothetical protein
MQIVAYQKMDEKEFDIDELIESYLHASMCLQEVETTSQDTAKVDKQQMNDEQATNVARAPNEGPLQTCHVFEVSPDHMVQPGSTLHVTNKISRSELLNKATSRCSNDGTCSKRLESHEMRNTALAPNEETAASFMAQKYGAKKYKPVHLKTKPIYGELPDKFRIKRNITGDMLAALPKLSPHPPEFVPTERYTEERRKIIDDNHPEGFLWPEERKLLHHLMLLHEKTFAWEDSEAGSFRKDFFPPVEFPVVEHKPWVLKNIPIPPGLFDEVCRIIKAKIESGAYEPSNSSYRSRYFVVLKKDGKSLRVVHSLEPLNEVTIAHSGVPPATEELAEACAGRACGGTLDLYVGYDEREIDEKSRDLTTFQTPYGAMRLVKLPMGWTNSVPIFHEDVSAILRDEIPKYTRPYIDDVPAIGPRTRYELPGGGYETIPGNPGIRRFVWEHMQNVNRICQRIHYCGATFAGKKAYICCEEIEVAGHRCTYEGRKPTINRVGVIQNWGPCKDVSDVRSFLGTVGVCRMFIKGYAEHAEPLVKLTRLKETFRWEEEQQNAMNKLKELLTNCPAIRPLRYEWDSEIVLAVDTSWRAVGFFIYQADPDEPKKKYYARFGSITMNEREARFSQPKRELFGLLRALEASHYWLYGARNLVVETDAKYIKGMLNNPGMGPNATINRWIEKILMFHFSLRHVAGKTFAADGLSRREPQAGDEVFPNSEEEYEKEFEEVPYEQAPDADDPLEFDEFRETIDTRGGYFLAGYKLNSDGTAFHGLATSVTDLKDEHRQAKMERGIWKCFSQLETIAKAPDQVFDPVAEKYEETHRTKTAIRQDEQLPIIKEWLKDTTVRPEEYRYSPEEPQNSETRRHLNNEYMKFIRYARRFFVDPSDRLYRRRDDSQHQLVLDKDRRMYALQSTHDALGHRGFYATNALIGQRFWWPEIERDVNWYVKTCTLCQRRQKTLLRIPPVQTHTPTLFEKFVCDTMMMSPASNGCKYVVQGRDVLSSWLEGRALKEETARTIAQWLFEEIIMRWGCIREILTDNSPVFTAAVKWLEKKYGIKGIKITPYNSRANGKAEQTHWEVRQALHKATGGDLSKWFWFYPMVKWADRITIRKGLGCSPFFATTGAHPIIPLDIIEATWLVELPGRTLTTTELIGYRARALAKHQTHVEELRRRIAGQKHAAVKELEEKFAHQIKDYKFNRGDLVLMRNTAIESSLDRKMYARYLGPMIVLHRNKGGSYVLAEMDGSVHGKRVSAFRVVPYYARHAVELPENLEEFTGVSDEDMKELPDEVMLKTAKPDLWFGSRKLNTQNDLEASADDSDNDNDE